MKFEITQKHIDEGAACDGSRCTVALALRDALKLRHKPRRGLYVGFMRPTEIAGVHYYPSPETQKAVYLLDHKLRAEIKPGIYEMSRTPRDLGGFFCQKGNPPLAV